MKREHLLPYLGRLPADGPVVDFNPLVEAAAAAAGLPDLMGRSVDVVDARRAAVQAVGTKLSTPQTARLLGVSRRTVERLRNQPFDLRLVQAIRLQLRLRQPAAGPASPVLVTGEAVGQRIPTAGKSRLVIPHRG